MPVVDARTEELIKETAMRIFFVEGRLHATTQVIAKEAGVNRGLIYYYFQSRDQLFEAVFKEASMVTRGRLRDLLLSNGKSFQEKIGEFVELTIDHGMKYPYLEMFLVTEMNRDGSTLLIPLEDDTRKELLRNLGKALNDEIAKGTVPKMSPEQFLINVLSLCTYPTLYKPILQQMANIDTPRYLKMMEERKTLVMKVLFRGY
ncbi:MAG: TetR/AcrR family transcriptional regulator [Puia sp.]|nr:TetR/AcrR family transcriptional regulator [Puia sp.]